MASVFRIFFILNLLLLSSCQEIVINVTKSNIIITPPEVPTVLLLAVPDDSSKSPVFALSSNRATYFQIKIYRSSDDVLIQDWMTITPGSSVSGATLNESTSYYAVFRAVNSAGMSSETTSENWIPNSEECIGAMITSITYAGGDGSHLDPYQICTSDQLMHFASDAANFNKTFKLMANLDLASVSFDGIGSSVNPFEGRFKGNNKSIRNMTILKASGDSVGFFNETNYAIITDVTFENPSITALNSTDVGIISGYSESSSFKNITIINSTISAEKSIGLLVGSSYACLIHDIVIAGDVTSNLGSVGGIIGDSDTSSVINAVLTVNINAPTGNDVGGAVGISGSSSTRLQNVHITGAVEGFGRVGGFLGTEGDGFMLYRSSFNGAVIGTKAVGGVLGVSYDTPVKVASVSSQFTIEANQNAGGLIGELAYNLDADDVYIQGTITATGASAQNFGGMIGELTYDRGHLNHSLGIVTITGNAFNVGGMVGAEFDEAFSSSEFNHADNALIVDVTGNDAANSISLFSGDYYLNAMIGTSYYWSGGLCNNTGTGGCNTSEGTPVASLASFYTNTSLPMLNWDFSNIWKINPGSFPELLQVQNYAPTATFNCHNQLLSGAKVYCPVSSTDLDPHEFRAISFGPDHTCRWLEISYGSNNDLYGFNIPEAGTCDLSFVLTDGVYDSNPINLQVQIFDDISISPMPGPFFYSYDVGGVAVSGGPLSVTFTITNNKPFPISGFSVSGFTEGSFSRSGGTCGATLAPSSNCTVIIDFDPASLGIHLETMDINFTHASGPVRIEYAMHGIGT